MRSILVLLNMLWLHIFADYHLQGILASLKQVKWWRNQDIISKDEWPLYKNDYKAGLLCHAFEWTFVMMLPITVKLWTMLNGFTWMSLWRMLIFLLLFAGNVCSHYGVDDMKANKKVLNLIDDQIFHFIQVVITWVFSVFIVGW